MHAVRLLVALAVLAGRGVPALEAPLVEVQTGGVGDSVRVMLRWEPVAGATSYRVLGRAGWLEEAGTLAQLDTCGVDLPWTGPLGLFTVTARSALPEMLPVPAGTFVMGSGDADNRLHSVTLTRDYTLARTETTNAEFLDALNWAWAQGGLVIDHDIYTDMDWVCWGSSQLVPVARDDRDDLEIHFDGQAGRFVLHAGTFNSNAWGPGFAYPGGYDPAPHPVKYVTWMGAAAYCDWLSLRGGLTPYYNNDFNHDPTVHSPYEAQGWRLPTEAEWERAAKFDDGRLYPWGNETPSCQRVNYRYPGYCVGWTEAVGSHPLGSSALGFQDLSGNVMEWCNEYAQLYVSEDPVTDPVGPSTSTYRSLRNGCWNSFSNAHMRVSWRGQSLPTRGYDYVGFRVCRSAP
jgi:formylglycine-generating enzyme required for sulfatase activity